ncbi:unnamed protein product [Cyprideis torosa]|uniref:Phospholipase A2 n=1 Tax=Cyprideis torosa TaxID=163714 RepID=A0A7R8WBI4_9CRUS|nr:unnamed protein product [Cyprideis torosa]CAG0886325.1 unnamed protein product [Cyprideis torosa]
MDVVDNASAAVAQKSKLRRISRSERTPVDHWGHWHNTFFQGLKAKFTKSYDGTLVGLSGSPSFDPFQVFEVRHRFCALLNVKILYGEKITKGKAADFLDTPDPYILLNIPGTPNTRKRTKHINNCTSPVWNQEFSFYIDQEANPILEITLMDANVKFDQIIGSETIPIKTLALNETKKHLIRSNPDLRYSLSLCIQERAFVRRRMNHVYRALNKLLGEDGPDDIHEVPTIAILGSGGGFRAMTAMTGVVNALWEEGIFDVATYVAGLSGSSWYLSTLYSHPDFPKAASPRDVQAELCARICLDWKRFLSLSNLNKYRQAFLQKKSLGQPVSFADIFGMLLGDVLLPDRKDATLSDQQELLVDGDLPFPLYTCIHVKEDVSAILFQEWVEFSPFEIGIPKYGISLKPRDFGCKFFMGKIIRRFDEYKLCTLQGVWGSAFSILFTRLNQGDAKGGEKNPGNELEDIATLRNNLDKMPLPTPAYVDGEEERLAGQLAEAEVSADPSSSSDEYEEDANADELISLQGEEDRVSPPPLAVIPKKKSSWLSWLTGKRKQSMDRNTTPQSHDTNKRAKKHRRTQSGGPFLRLPPKEQRDSRPSLPTNSLLSTPASRSQPPTPPNNPLRQYHRHRSLSVPQVDGRKHSSPVPKSSSKESQDQIRRASLPSDILHSTSLSKQSILSPATKVSKHPSSTRSEPPGSIKNNYWRERGLTIREKKSKRNKSSWDKCAKVLARSDLLSGRKWRAPIIFNPLRGIPLENRFPISPYAAAVQESDVETDDPDFKLGREQASDTKSKYSFVVDAGLCINSPYPVLLRPQRNVELYLSFDFSGRKSDQAPPFKELEQAEKWARLNHVKFPPVKKLVEEFRKEEMRECYVFEDPEDPSCPIILHFVLLNLSFKEFKAPGVPRETEEEKAFADFSIFSDPKTPYSMYNFQYTKMQFERLSQLTEYNTRINIPVSELTRGKYVIKECILRVMKRRRDRAMTPPVSLADIDRLRQRLSFKGPREVKQLREYVKRLSSLQQHM